ncbi:armadillo-type protein [Pelagophyceae sp. CCMP2097]|nr:armadillo-type protein [Pelagophyceae sp. CCMP2097]
MQFLAGARASRASLLRRGLLQSARRYPAPPQRRCLFLATAKRLASKEGLVINPKQPKGDKDVNALAQKRDAVGLVDVLRSGRYRLKMEAAFAVHKLALKDASMRGALGDAGGVELLIELLREPQSAEAQKAFASALLSLADEHAANERRMVRLGAVELFVALLKDEPSETRNYAVALMDIFSSLVPAHQQRVVDCGGVNALARLARTALDDDDRMLAAGALSALLWHDGAKPLVAMSLGLKPDAKEHVIGDRIVDIVASRKFKMDFKNEDMHQDTGDTGVRFNPGAGLVRPSQDPIQKRPDEDPRQKRPDKGTRRPGPN